jgi:hypothetical protein
VRIAKADLVPTEANLRTEYDSFADLVAACEVFTDEVNARVHLETGRVPAEALLIKAEPMLRSPTKYDAAAATRSSPSSGQRSWCHKTGRKRAWCEQQRSVR